VVGDAFAARFFDNDDDFKRMDFVLSELDSGAPWIKIAREQVCSYPMASVCCECAATSYPIFA
jgi:hypothetical protein